MGFKIVHERGRSYPRAFCDHCQQQLDCDGNVEWEWDCPQSEPHNHTFQLLHKSCSDVLNRERLRKGMPSTLWMPLDHMLVYLAKNLKINWKVSSRNAEGIASIF